MIVYTAIFGDYDTLNPPYPDSDCPHICFTDGDYKCDGWEIINVKRQYSNPILEARRCKAIAPWEMLPKSDIYLWMDGAIKEIRPITSEFAESIMDNMDITLFKHRWNNCLSQELKSCIHHKKDDETLMRSQVNKYFDEGFPRKYGVSHTAVMFRRNNSKVKDFSYLWWSQIRSGSIRDQLSFDYCRWKTGVECKWLPNTICNNPIVKHYPKHPKAKK